MNRGQVYSVSSINQYIKNMFSKEYALSVVFVKGEISNCKYHSSGHIYFTLKDAGSALTCVMFAGDRRGLAFKMENGQEVIVGGSINVYERDGKYQLYAKKITLAGAGVLAEEYERLKKKLAADGYFDEEFKRPIPRFVKRVGIVTAKTGAAIQDMIQVSHRRNPYVQLILYPAKVQGEGASKTIVAGIEYLDALGVDVIIVGRGGGSIEDLWAFNEEATAHAIFQSGTPVISAVGHETDTTIADYVADLRAPTPSAAAELAVYDVNQVLDALDEAQARMMRSMWERMDMLRQQIGQYERRIRYMNPMNQLNQKRQYVVDLEDKLCEKMRQILRNKKVELQLLASRLDGVSPLKRLESGYAYVADEKGNQVTSAEQLNQGDSILVTVVDGTVKAEVKSVEVRK